MRIGWVQLRDILTLQKMSNQSKVPHNINTITHNNIINFHSTNKGIVFSQHLFLKNNLISSPRSGEIRRFFLEIVHTLNNIVTCKTSQRMS